MKDTLRDKIAEIVDYCSESYYPEHEYGNTWADRNKEYLAEAVDQILSLIEEEKNKAETKIVQKYLDINMRNGHVSRGLLENDLATLNSKDEYSIEDIKSGKVKSDIKKLSGIPDHFKSKEQK